MEKMNKIRIKRKKHFNGALVSYQIILGYDIEKFKELIMEISNYYKLGQQDLEKEKYFYNEINKIKYLTIKNGETKYIELPEEIKTLFVCNNAILNNQFYPTLYYCYPLVCSNQVEIDNNMNLELKTKGGWKKIEFILTKVNNIVRK